jgi:hypothetical protein
MGLSQHQLMPWHEDLHEIVVYALSFATLFFVHERLTLASVQLHCCPAPDEHLAAPWHCCPHTHFLARPHSLPASGTRAGCWERMEAPSGWRLPGRCRDPATHGQGWVHLQSNGIVCACQACHRSIGAEGLCCAGHKPAGPAVCLPVVRQGPVLAGIAQPKHVLVCRPHPTCVLMYLTSTHAHTASSPPVRRSTASESVEHRGGRMTRFRLVDATKG